MAPYGYPAYPLRVHLKIPYHIAQKKFRNMITILVIILKCNFAPNKVIKICVTFGFDDSW